MKKCIVLFLLTFITGCSTVVYVPHDAQLWNIKKMEKDCKVASLEVQNLFLSEGENSRLVCGFVSGYEDVVAHCWNEVWSPEDQKWHVIDLSADFMVAGWPREQYPEYRPVVMWYGMPTVMDLVYDTNADWHINESEEYIVASLDLVRSRSVYEKFVPASRPSF